MLNYYMQDIASIVDGNLIGDGRQLIRQVSTDSRTTAPAGDVLFFALKGVRNDGHRYVDALYGSGVRNFLLQTPPVDLQKFGDANIIMVPDSLAALQYLAKVHRANHSCEVIGITGSNGKTVVKEWLFQLLRQERSLVRSPRSYNSQVGVPLSVLMLSNQHDMALFEAGISQPGEMDRLQDIIDPDIGIMTNIGEAHQENFSSTGEKIREKIKLFTGSHTIIYPADYELLDSIIRTTYPEKELFTWSRGAPAAVQVSKITSSREHTAVSLEYAGKAMDMDIPFTDLASIENALTCISVLLYLDLGGTSIQEGLLALGPVAMRLELVNGKNGCTLINDSYNSDLHSLSIALDYLNQQNQHEAKRLILSDIQQSGREEAALYSEVADLLGKKGISRFIGVGQDIGRHRDLFPPGASFYTSTEELLSSGEMMHFDREAILIKGSRQFEFERIVRFLEEKLHRTVMEVDLEAMVHNLNVYRSMLRRDTAIMVMVKALSYGSGSWEIANVLQYQNVDYLCVAYTDEAVALRKAGISLPIMVMNPELSGFEELLEYSLEPEVFSIRSLHRIARLISRAENIPVRVHVKLETGMNRLGFTSEQLPDLIACLKEYPSIEVRSVFSHLAASGDPSQDDFTRAQLHVFETLSSRIIAEFDYPVLRHILNTGGIERFPAEQYDMVRLGIGLYGISGMIPERLMPVNRLSSVLSQVRVIQEGESVGYGRSFMAKRETRIGIVPIGYADGLNRKLGQGNASLKVNGKQAPVIGNICMDMCMIDLTGIPAGEGDEVVIFDDAATLVELARQSGTIPYEILAGISGRVKRVYYQ